MIGAAFRRIPILYENKSRVISTTKSISKSFSIICSLIIGISGGISTGITITYIDRKNYYNKTKEIY